MNDEHIKEKDKAMTTLVRIDPDLRAKLDCWLAQQPVAPTVTAVVNAAVRKFLEEQSR